MIPHVTPKLQLKHSVLLVLLFTFIQLGAFITTLYGQITSKTDTTRICYTDYMTRLMKDKFPTAPSLSRKLESAENVNYYVIPVVVHVIHQGGSENISDKLIQSQIDVLNEDFGHYGSSNNDPRGTDTKIRFCLAKKDPNKNPTTGIERIFSQYADLVSGNEMLTKDLSKWDPYRYMNFWVVKTIDGSSNIQAYSYLPSNSAGPSYAGDGVVVNYLYFGRGGNFKPLYNQGKTSSHESGHYFDLMHTWGKDEPGFGDCNDDDGIDDTPVCSLEYYSSPVTNCFHPVQCGNIRMVENFLDYSYDGCLKIFTPGQAKKMVSAIGRYRSELVSSANLADCGCKDLYDSLNSIVDIQLYPTIVSNNEISLSIKNRFAQPLSFNIYDLFGKLMYSDEYANVATQTIQIQFNKNNLQFRPGVYILRGTYGSLFQRKFVVVAP